MFTVAQFTIAKTWKQPKCPLTDEWVKKIQYIHTYNGILSSHKKEWNNVCSNMDVEIIILSKSDLLRQISYDKDKYHIEERQISYGNTDAI